MDFGTRLATLRKQRTMTRQAWADAVNCHVTMIGRYDANETRPMLGIIRNVARALSVSADSLVFEQDERGPSQQLLMQFLAVRQLLPADQVAIKDVLEGLILKYQGKRWGTANKVATPAAPKRWEQARRAAPTGTRR
jgi:transcriptional regulator with XRE-family HTH domain